MLDKILEAPGFVFIPSALTGLVCAFLTFVFMAIIIRRKSNAWDKEKLGLRGLANLDIGELEALIDNVVAQKRGSTFKLTSFLRRKISETDGELIQRLTESTSRHVFTIDTKDVSEEDVRDMLSKIKKSLKKRIVDPKKALQDLADMENDAVHRDLTAKDMEDLHRFARSKPELATFHKMTKNRNGDYLFTECGLRDLRIGDLFKTSNDPEGRIHRTLSNPRENKDGIGMIDTITETDNIEAFIQWCRRIMEPRGLHRDTERHLRKLFASDGDCLASQKRISGRTTARCLWAAYQGTKLKPGVENDLDQKIDCAAQSQAVVRFTTIAIRKGEWFPGIGV